MNRALTKGRTTPIWTEADANVCLNCMHFVQHYLADGRTVACGHCVYPRLKFRMIYDTCRYFEREES